MTQETGISWGGWLRVIIVGMLLLVAATVVFADEEPVREPPGFFEIWLISRVWMPAIFALIGLGMLMKSWVTRNLRMIILPVIFLVFSVVAVLPLGEFAKGMGLHPSPVCTITKPFLFLHYKGIVPIGFISVFVSIAVLTIIGNKLFCGWVCPIGALQELVHRIKAPKVKLPFKIANWVRILLFVVFVIAALAFGIETYEYFNPFEFLHWGFEFLSVAVLVVTLIAAVFLFRPFCYLICPLGLFTWVLEHLSLVRVRLNKDACTECNECVDESNCPAVPAILDLKKSRPDCHACGRCIEICPEDALKFK